MGVATEAAPRIDTTKAASARAAARIVAALFVLTTVLGASLLYAAEPMLVTMLLPGYGGSPMVWSTSVLFLQTVLFAGCSFAHWSQRLLGVRRQVLIQVPLVIAPVLVLPFALPAWSQPHAAAPAALWLTLVLVSVVGAPLAMLATTGPLVQRWYHRSDLPRSRDPYFLYAVGNAGGMLALAAYSLVIEPTVDMATRTRWWEVGYGIFAALVVACAITVRLRPTRIPPVASAHGQTVPWEQISWRRRARWLLVAFIPAALTLGVTAHLATGVDPAPSMWQVPLALYLATLAIAFGFEKRPWLGRTVTIAAVSSTVLPWTLYLLRFRARADGIPLALALAVVGGLACHGILAKDRPTPRRLTEFFVISSLGAALGAAFSGLVAPIVFGRGAALPLAATALAVLSLTGRPDEAGAPWRWARAGAVFNAFVISGPLLMVAVYVQLGGAWLVVIVMAAGLPWCSLAVHRPRALAAGAALTTAVLLWYQAPTDAARRHTFLGGHQVDTGNGTTLHGSRSPWGVRRA
jgi:hypothetical protein